ncbi:MAG: cob(I)yrinic acid a,c-diamide adenosyltransferase [bacterium]
MLYTGKGDSGTTKLFNTPSGERISKTSPVFDALGTTDELVAHVGYLKVLVSNHTEKVLDKNLAIILHEVQESLFVIQAQLAGAAMPLPPQKVADLEALTNAIETTLPPIITFFIAGGTQEAAFADICRTIARRMERDILRAQAPLVEESTYAYTNRLSSLFYALARLLNHISGIKEEPPTYS